MKHTSIKVIALVFLSLGIFTFNGKAQVLSTNERTTILTDLNESIRLLSKFQYDSPELISIYASQLKDAQETYRTK